MASCLVTPSDRLFSLSPRKCGSINAESLASLATVSLIFAITFWVDRCATRTDSERVALQHMCTYAWIYTFHRFICLSAERDYFIIRLRLRAPFELSIHLPVRREESLLLSSNDNRRNESNGKAPFLFITFSRIKLKRFDATIIAMKHTGGKNRRVRELEAWKRNCSRTWNIRTLSDTRVYSISST